MSQSNPCLSKVPATAALRSLYEHILTRGQSNIGARGEVVLASIRRHHYAELNAVARIFQQQAQTNTKDCLSSIRAILIKPVNDACNLKCTYCYEGDGMSRSHGKMMTEADIIRITSEVLSTPRRDIQFLWHGGEPLLAGISFYKRAIEAQKKFNIYGVQIYNAIQSNGILLNQEWVTFLKENGIGISLSIDGPAFLHDETRTDLLSEGTFCRVMEAAKLLQENDVAFNVISVVGPSHVGNEDAYWKFIKQSKIKRFDLHPSNRIGIDAQPPVGQAEFSEFVNKVFDYWLDNGDSTIHIGLIDEFFRLLSGNPPQTCYHAGACSDIIAIEGNGSVMPCTRPFDREKHCFGNVESDSLRSIVSSSNFLSFKDLDKKAQKKTEGCRWHELCRNGCPQQRMVDGTQDIGGKGYYCQCQTAIPGGYYQVWNHVYNTVRAVFGCNRDFFIE